MDVNKNSYTFIFAIIMVVVVGLLLSAAAISLKPMQDRNIEQEKMQDILSTIGFSKDDTPREEAAELFPQFVKEQIVLDVKGNEVDGEAFKVDLAKEVKKARDEQNWPLYIAEKEEATYYVIPLRGKGLWGPIWGYISLESDINTVYGASFDHKTETPGLGAEINKGFFQDQFIGKKIMKDGSFVSIAVVKSGASGMYEVDGISGGTITSVGVDNMLQECISFYMPYFEKLESGQMSMNAE
jgi:Na+-transporting NADH:ubiquinone oxidoreductase subunit C